VKRNYETLGTAVPHLHTHVMPRYADDPRPGFPFPHPAERPPPHAEADLRRDSETLRRLLGYS
jgi:diadenosine tetraphosphate (Ap4A) HIT family hydrolase